MVQMAVDERPTMAIVPPSAQGRMVASVGDTSHHQYAGVHDSMRYGLRSIAAEAQSSAVGAASAHPLENRLGSWDETRDTMQQNMQRNLHGIASPLHTLMERKIASYDPHYPTIGGGLSDMHLSILRGTDEALDPQEYLPVRRNWDGVDMHAVMEKKHGV